MTKEDAILHHLDVLDKFCLPMAMHLKKFGRFFREHQQDHAEDPDSWIERECFRNACLRSFDGCYIYVEGFAAPDFLDTPIHHAWCVDKAGKILDLTWKKPGAAYFGTPFKGEYVRHAAITSGVYGIYDNFNWRDIHDNYSLDILEAV